MPIIEVPFTAAEYADFLRYACREGEKEDVAIHRIVKSEMLSNKLKNDIRNPSY